VLERKQLVLTGLVAWIDQSEDAQDLVPRLRYRDHAVAVADRPRAAAGVGEYLGAVPSRLPDVRLRPIRTAPRA
jgi:hypothetical protein